MAVEDWLAYGLANRSAATVSKYQILCAKHIIPMLGARRLRDLTAREVEDWLRGLSLSLSTETLHRVRACLNRAVKRAMARDLVKRNVVELAEVPAGRSGRPSKSLTPEQAMTCSPRPHPIACTTTWFFLCSLAGGQRSYARCAGSMYTLKVGPMSRRPYRHMSRSGVPFA